MESEIKKYTFKGAIYPKYANDMITFVKKLEDKLIIFDRKGRLQINNLQEETKIINIHCDTFSLLNIFNYTDCNNRQLLIAYNDEKIYAWNLLDEYPHVNEIKINNQFNIYQTPNKELIMYNIKDTGVYSILEIDWEIAKTWYKYGCRNVQESGNPRDKNEQPFKLTPIDFDDLQKIKIINEGTIIESHTLQLNSEKYDLDKKIFDIESIPSDKESREWMSGYKEKSLPNIFCYHKTIEDSYYLGHDGRISVWIK